MKIGTTIYLLFFFSFLYNAQTEKEVTKALKNVNNLDQVNELKEKHPYWTISIDKTLISDSTKFPNVTTAQIGDIVSKQYNSKAPKFALKILSTEDEELCKVKYIYLDGNKYSKEEIDSIRTIIINRYENGEDFVSLVKEYNMDGNPNGDLGWFYKGMMVEEFDTAVRNRSKGDIFTVDVDKNNWYYVVLKNNDNKTEKAILGIKIKYS